MRINAKTFRNWFMANYTKGEMRDIARDASGGFPHITYYNDTTKIYNRFEDEIWESLQDDAEDFGYDNPLTMIVETFNHHSVRMIDSATQFKNLMVWYMCEKLARELTEDN